MTDTQCRTCYGTGQVYEPDAYGTGRVRACYSCPGTGRCDHADVSPEGVCDDCSAQTRTATSKRVMAHAAK